MTLPRNQEKPSLQDGSSHSPVCVCVRARVCFIFVVAVVVGCQVLLRLQCEEGLEMTVVPPWLCRVEERKQGPVNPEAGEQHQLGLS